METGRIVFLEAEIRRHQNLYYNGEPEISDAEFDRLWDELQQGDPGNALFDAVGRDLADGWPKARHLIPMGSQDKAASPGEFLAWAAKVAHPLWLVQHKLDGASIELQYENGRFVRAVTRGDGEVGDDITPNARRMKGVLPMTRDSFSGGVRGEVLMRRSVHAARYADKANCRNAANGLMKRKDGEGSGDLEVVCYDAVGTLPMEGSSPSAEGRQPPFSDEAGKLRWLSQQGFAVVEARSCDTALAVVEYRAHVFDARPGMDYDIDGLVVKGFAIDPEDQARPRPEKQIAFKFSLEEAISTLIAVEWSESGANFTPIGIVEPVRLAGTTVQRANLCNTDMITTLNLRIGSRVIMTKRGEIIPKIEGLVENPPDAREIPIPTACSCGASLVDGGTRLYCPNEACPKKELHRLEKWLAVVDVRSFGVGIIGKLHASGRVREIADLYTLSVDELAAYERMGETSAAKILRNLRAPKELSLERFIAGFDLDGIGELIAGKAVASGYNSLEKLRAATVEEIDAVDGFAEITAKALLDGLGALAQPMDRVLELGIVTIAAPRAGGAFTGKSFCFTGELASMKRSEAEARVKSLGGTCRAAVTKGLAYLVTNDPGSGSSKNRKALEYGVAIIDEASFLELVHGV
ncbi:MAG: NAD-dependent DNA ligase LigA [Rectinemataceae bacterium]